MAFEAVEIDGIRYAEIIWSGTTVASSTFYSPAAQSFQFGLLAHAAGFLEAAHTHKPVPRSISDVQQMLVVQRGVIAVAFHDAGGKVLREVVLRAGDAITLIHGAHSVRVLEDMQCVSVKQGPFLGIDADKVNLEPKA